MLHFRSLTARSVFTSVTPHTPSPVPPNTSVSGSADAPEPRQPTGERILLVDDEAVLRRLARTILLRQGYNVVEASGPAEALVLAAAQPDSFDLLLADVMMPGMRGWEMVKLLRVSQPRARVLYMSGYAGDLESAGGKVRPLLAKPFKPRELLDEVRRVLDAT
jgi:two-component system, cell cycle sensor histidine kinase and response regulator CckA